MNFKQEVFGLVERIPRGRVATYGQIAQELGRPRWARQVGWSLHQNKSADVPCHRVVAQDGRLAPNFAFGGWRRQKEKLLAEGVKFRNERHVDAGSFANLRPGAGRIF